MMEEKNSLLAYRIGGAADQILADDTAIYVVKLGTSRDGGAVYRSIRDVSAFRPGPNAVRIAKADIEFARVRLGDDRTEICINTADDEHTWHMDVRLPDEAVRMIFGGLNLICEEMDEADENAGELPPFPGGDVLLEVSIGALAVFLPVMWWIRAGVFLLWANLLFLPLGLVLLARFAGRRWGRFKWIRGLWLMPGIGLTLMNVRTNLPHPEQIVIPSIAMALLLALFYALLSGKRRTLRRTAVVLVVCMLTYVPGALLSINAMAGECLRSSRVTPRIVRSDYVEVPLDGRLQRFYVHPSICREMSVNAACELRLNRGLLGIEYWTAVPQNWDKVV